MKKHAPKSGLSGQWWRDIVVCHGDNDGGDGGCTEDFMVMVSVSIGVGVVDVGVQYPFRMVWNGLEFGTGRAGPSFQIFIWNEGTFSLEQIWNAACPSIWNFRTV